MTIELLTEKFDILDSYKIEDNWSIKVNSVILLELLRFLKNTSELDFDMLYSIVGSDFETFFRLEYVLCSTKLKKSITVRVDLSKNQSTITSVRDIYQSADWDEREIFDLFGIDFTGRGAIERLFMPKGWIGHPLRKDYVQDDKRMAWNYD